MPDFVAPVLWTLLGVAATAFWLRRLVRADRYTTTVTPLSRDQRAATAGLGRVSIIMAAKDEEASIATSVRGLLAQDYRDAELIVVDDRSGDRTPELLRALAAESGGACQVLSVAQLPDGWAGKCHAIQQAIPLATGDWLCFTDADCRIAPNALSLVLEHACTNGLDFVSMIPELDAPTLWERFIQPVCVLALLSWTRPQHVPNPQSNAAHANGAFMLIRRHCYQALGGHASVRADLNEDVRLAQRAKRAGFRLGVISSVGLCQTRMYDSARRMWQGWTRIFYGCADSPAQIVRTAIWLAIIGIAPVLIFAGALTAASTAQRPIAWSLAAAAWGSVLIMQHLAVRRVYRHIRVESGARGFIIGVAVTVVILLNAVIKRMGWSDITWRGTTYGRPQVP